MATINDEDLVFHFLNVGHGDAILIGFPAVNGKRRYGLVDCNNGTKTEKYLDKLMPDPADRDRLLFICATHPHLDHIRGINSLLNHPVYHPEWFWDSGFRYPSDNYRTILQTISEADDIKMVRVTSGMERYFGRVRVTALAPSVRLRNRYATYGVDSNNASIVLRFEHHEGDILVSESIKYEEGTRTYDEVMTQAGKSVVILAGDAEFDSWAHIVEEFPVQHEENVEAATSQMKLLNNLSTWVVKVPHHGSMHSASLDVYEKMGEPSLAIVSNKQKKGKIRIGDLEVERGKFPHPSTVNSLHETTTKILTTDGSYESEVVAGAPRDAANQDAGNIVVALPPPPGKPKYIKVPDGTGSATPPPQGAVLTIL